MKITLICAMGKNREIGEKNALLWDLPEDMKHFRMRTAGQIVVMGRKTYESIGMLLPKRRNIILTRNADFSVEGAEIFPNIDEMLEKLYEDEDALGDSEISGELEIFVIGGANIYEQFLPLATHLSLTFVDQDFPNADAFFPEISDKIEAGEFREISKKHIPKDSEHAFAFDICEFERV